MPKVEAKAGSEGLHGRAATGAAPTSNSSLEPASSAAASGAPTTGPHSFKVASSGGCQLLRG